MDKLRKVADIVPILNIAGKVADKKAEMDEKEKPPGLKRQSQMNMGGDVTPSGDSAQTTHQNDNSTNLLSLIFFVLAAYLSWSCNTVRYPSMNDVEKGIRAFFAGFFGLFYLIYYFAFEKADCAKAAEEALKAAAQPPLR